MAIDVNLRSEQKNDIHQINDVILSAFRNHPHSNQKEHLLVSALREQDALSVSLVAEYNGKIVGHIAFSEVTIDGEPCQWYGLAPVSVIPQFQNRGIGSKLIQEGLNRIKKLGANGCVLLGEPEYYNRFGFHEIGGLILEGVPPEYFLGLHIRGEIPQGRVQYHETFQTFG